MNKTKKFVKTRKFFADHKTEFALGTITVLSLVIALQRSGLNDHNEFLKKHDLLDEYWSEAEDE